MNRDFSKGKIYKITNDFNDEIYIGSTCDTLVKRFSIHKVAINIIEKQDRPLYKLMREIGTDRFIIYLIEDFPCNNKYELERQEGFWQKHYKSSLNMVIAGQTKTEYREEHREKMVSYSKTYNEEHKEQLSEKKKLNYYSNQEEILKQKQQYYSVNQERILEKLKEKIKCECGCDVTKAFLPNHKQTKKHINLLNQQLAIQSI